MATLLLFPIAWLIARLIVPKSGPRARAKPNEP